MFPKKSVSFPKGKREGRMESREVGGKREGEWKDEVAREKSHIG